MDPISLEVGRGAGQAGFYPVSKIALKKKKNLFLLVFVFVFVFYISSLCEKYLEERNAAFKKSEPDSSWKGPCHCFSAEDLGGV